MMTDLLSMLTLQYTPRAICWVHQRGASLPLLAVSDNFDHSISIYDGRGEKTEPTKVLTHLHRRSISVMTYNEPFDTVVSVDEGGMLEYWRPNGTFEKPDEVFKFKSSTNLFDFKKVIS